MPLVYPLREIAAEREVTGVPEVTQIINDEPGTGHLIPGTLAKYFNTDKG